MTHAQATDELRNKYREAPKSAGVTNAGDLVVLYSTADGAAWTILAVLPNGCAKILAAGQDWRGRPVGNPV